MWSANVRLRPIADITLIGDGPCTIRTLPAAIRTSAALGGLLWGLALLYFLLLLSTGFVNGTAPNLYVTALTILIGVALNVALFRRSDVPRASSTIALLLLSLALSASLLGTLAYVAFDPS